MADSPVLDNLADLAATAVPAVEGVLDKAIESVGAMVVVDGKASGEALSAHQSAAHGMAWVATCAESLRQMHAWADRLDAAGGFGELERLILQIAFGECLHHVAGGIPMNQGETVRLQGMGLGWDALSGFHCPEVQTLMGAGNTQAARTRLVELMREREGEATAGATGFDEDLEAIRAQFRRYVIERIEPHAHGWHLRDELIPMEVVTGLAELGVFGLAIPEAHGGLGLSKAATAVVSEELSRGYLGVGSLGTRSDIAAELILCGGTEAQKAHWLPRIASAEVLTTAVFTEPDSGSDLGGLSTRAVRDGDDYLITGAKTWITHAARAGMMTLMARTDPDSKDHRGLSVFLAEKEPGSPADPFPSDGITGTEIEALGYRGMKEYEMAFDGFRVAGGNLLGGEEGAGFKQLMQTFESARIQTAARAVGVAQSALDAAMRYALERRQFGKQLIAFPRVSGKIAMMAAEVMVARQLTHFSALRKDGGERCDLEAGMAKLLGARVAWAAADNAVQIHGGNGFSTEYPVSRILCDARILNIFEGAAEIQAEVIARRLLA